MIFTRLEHFWTTYFSKLFQNFGLEAPYFLIRLSFSLLHKQKQVKRGIFTRPFVAMFQTLQFQIKKKNFYGVLNCSSIIVNIALNVNQAHSLTSFCQQLSAQATYKSDFLHKACNYRADLGSSIFFSRKIYMFSFQKVRLC